ncbi:hypothetical protein [Marinigracilibium pacificum]|uniref:Uncharacterized protein n=1 Tax=Marinigracilibium pacificum TaxID=2729599 RepID=A0A848IY86_9BACT|nr:hypothetical protein [Marinigracilibium pacificum]NMM49463.1 hypothetical protein [Marinigracilibium pacificum]
MHFQRLIFHLLCIIILSNFCLAQSQLKNIELIPLGGTYLAIVTNQSIIIKDVVNDTERVFPTRFKNQLVFSGGNEIITFEPQTQQINFLDGNLNLVREISILDYVSTPIDIMFYQGFDAFSGLSFGGQKLINIDLKTGQVQEFEADQLLSKDDVSFVLPSRLPSLFLSNGRIGYVTTNNIQFIDIPKIDKVIGYQGKNLILHSENDLSYIFDLRQNNIYNCDGLSIDYQEKDSIKIIEGKLYYYSTQGHILPLSTEIYRCK